MQGKSQTADARPWKKTALRLAPFAAAAALAWVSVLIDPSIDWTLYAVATGLLFLAGAIRLAMLWIARHDGGPVISSLVFLAAVALLRSSTGGINSGVGVVSLITVFYIALYGENYRQLYLIIAGVTVFYITPIIFVGAPEYPSSQYRAALLTVAVSAIIGIATRRLVEEVRHQAEEAENREQALERVATVMRELSNSAHARVEVCEAAVKIGKASLAVLYEPMDTNGTLRSSAMSGLDLPTLEITPDKHSVAREAFVSRRSLFWNEGEELPSLNRDLWRGFGCPMSMLFEPVFRGEEPVGVLVVGWHQRIRSGSSNQSMIALLAHEIAAAIERTDLLSQLTDMASTDPLTGLRNLRAWEVNLAHALRSPEQLVLAMFDLDHFKDFNDTQGHPAGDRLLKETAAAWSEELREGDVLARVGGEEFALLLPKCSTNDALAIIERLRQRVPYEQSCSAGVVTHRRGESAEALMARVDEALYEAKETGRNRVALGA